MSDQAEPDGCKKGGQLSGKQDGKQEEDEQQIDAETEEKKPGEMPGEGKETDRREDGAEKAEYNGDRLIAEQRAEQRESPVGKRDSVSAHIIKLSRLSAGGRRRNRAEEETGKSITESLNRSDPIPGQTQTARDVPRIAHGIDGHTDKAEQQQAAVGLPKERGKVLTVQLSPDDPDGGCAQDKQQQNPCPE